MITFYVLLSPKTIIRGQILILYFLERIGPCLLGSSVLWALLSEFLASPGMGLGYRQELPGQYAGLECLLPRHHPGTKQVYPVLRLGSWQPYHTLRSALDLPNSQPANNDLAWTPESVILFFTVLLWEHSSLSTCDWNTTTLRPKTYLDCSLWLFHTLFKKRCLCCSKLKDMSKCKVHGSTFTKPASGSRNRTPGLPSSRYLPLQEAKLLFDFL